MSSYFDLKGWAHRLGQLSFSKYSSLLYQVVYALREKEESSHLGATVQAWSIDRMTYNSVKMPLDYNARD